VALPLRKRPFDLVLVCIFVAFAFSAFVMEPYVVFKIDFVHRAGDPFAAAWRMYASTWDPIFLDTPPWLQLLSGADEFLYGPFYLVLAYAFVRGRDWIRMPAIIWAGIIMFGTTFYFTMELWQERHRNSPLMVLAVNGPYFLVPFLTALRVRKPRPFSS
jgi:EXPERA (EXPanded EBP superfamily)